MKVIRLQYPHNVNFIGIPPLAMALGYFDGVHLGHRKVLMTALKVAKKENLASAVMTFDPHPSVVLGKTVQHVHYITPMKEKIEIMESLGFDYLFIVSFTKEFSALLPQEFVDHYIIDLNVQHVIAGFDFSYGRMGKGTMETLPFHSREKFQQTIVQKQSIEELKISSTLIRSYINAGKMDELPLLLGRYYTTAGIVVHGDKRGRLIGFPTANIDIGTEYLYPPTGVYAVRINIGEKWFEGVCNVGYKPTFTGDNQKITIEVYIFDFAREIYGEHVIVEWHKRIRDEQKFSGIDELVNQIQKDKEETIKFFQYA